MDQLEPEFSRLTTKGQCTLPRRIRDFLGVRPGDRVAFLQTRNGVLVKKLVVQEKAPERTSADRALRELVLAVGHEAQTRGYSEEDVGRDIDQFLKPRQKMRGK